MRNEMADKRADTLRRRLGWMADAIVTVKRPKSRFLSQERLDEIVLLLREAEKRIMELDRANG